MKAPDPTGLRSADSPPPPPNALCLEAEAAAGGPPHAWAGWGPPCAAFPAQNAPVPCLLPAVHLPEAPLSPSWFGRTESRPKYPASRIPAPRAARLGGSGEPENRADRQRHSQPAVLFLLSPSLVFRQPDELQRELGGCRAGDRRHLEPRDDQPGDGRSQVPGAPVVAMWAL